MQEFFFLKEIAFIIKKGGIQENGRKKNNI